MEHTARANRSAWGHRPPATWLYWSAPRRIGRVRGDLLQPGDRQVANAVPSLRRGRPERNSRVAGAGRAAGSRVDPVALECHRRAGRLAGRGERGARGLRPLWLAALDSHRRGAAIRWPGPRALSQLALRVYELGLKELFLPPTDAAEFFQKLGFMPVSRERAPGRIRNSRELRGFWPESETLLRLSLA